VGGLKDVDNSPKFATAVRLLNYGSEKEDYDIHFSSSSPKRESSTFNKVLTTMKKWFTDVS
jgi:cell division protein FtsA